MISMHSHARCARLGHTIIADDKLVYVRACARVSTFVCVLLCVCTQVAKQSACKPPILGGLWCALSQNLGCCPDQCSSMFSDFTSE